MRTAHSSTLRLSYCERMHFNMGISWLVFYLFSYCYGTSEFLLLWIVCSYSIAWFSPGRSFFLFIWRLFNFCAAGEQLESLKLPVLSSLAKVHCAIIEPLEFFFFFFFFWGGGNCIISFMVTCFLYFSEYIFGSFGHGFSIFFWIHFESLFPWKHIYFNKMLKRISVAGVNIHCQEKMKITLLL